MTSSRADPSKQRLFGMRLSWLDNPSTRRAHSGAAATPLGKDILLLRPASTGPKAFGELFEYRIEALSTTENIDFDDVDRPLSFHPSEDTVDDVGRDFSGVSGRGALARQKRKSASMSTGLGCAAAVAVAAVAHLRLPHFFFDEDATDDHHPRIPRARIHGLSSNVTTGSYPTLEYCVQYRESDLNFVCRLMEEYGLYYYLRTRKRRW